MFTAKIMLLICKYLVHILNKIYMTKTPIVCTFRHGNTIGTEELVGLWDFFVQGARDFLVSKQG